MTRRPTELPPASTGMDSGVAPVRAFAGPARNPLLAATIASALLALGLALPPWRIISAQAYLPLHTALEIIAICVSAMVFATGWNLRREEVNARPALLGAVFLAVAIVDIAHALSYGGMPVFVTPSGPEKAINFWLADCAIVAVGLLGIALLPARARRAGVLSAAFLAAIVLSAAVFWIGLFHADLVPRTFVAGQGLTPFKIGAEYAIVALHVAATGLLIRRAAHESSTDLYWLAAASWTLGAAELFFTLYADVSDLANIQGHAFRTAGYLMIYRAVFVAGVRAPYLALARERSLLRALLDATPDLVFFKDVRSRYLGFNRAFAEFCGRSESEMIGRTDREFTSPESAELYQRSDRAVVDTGKLERHEFWIEFPDGRRACLETLKAPLPGVDGRPAGLVGVSRDVTERKRMESELQDHRGRLEMLVGLRTEQLQQAKDAAEAASRAKNLFLANISHEIRTPLNAITGMAQLIALDPQTHGRHAERLRVMTEASEQLLGLIDDVLVLSKIEAGSSALDVAPFDIHELVDGVRAMMTGKAKSKGVALGAELVPPLDGRYVGDAMRLRQVLLNFVGNAVKFTDRGSIRLRARIECAEGERTCLRFEVEDTGVGIEAAHHRRIFDAFEQIEAPGGLRRGGTGLGLAISARIARQMGGDIGVDSRPGSGSTFWFTAWLVAVAVAAPAPQREAAR